VSEVKKLKRDNIEEVIKLSLIIFKPSIKFLDKDAHNYQKWIANFEINGVILGVFEKQALVGYVFAYCREKDILHYTMGGVKEDFRGHGLGRLLLEELEKEARKNDFRGITVNTYEDFWPVQYGFLKRHGYKLYKQEYNIKSDGKQHRKSYLKKKL
jgi:ribosomal protein S18 acetylase RimI-like enzyme